MGPYRERRQSPEPSSTHSLVIYLSLKDPGNQASLHVPHRVPKDTCFVPRANGLFVCSYPSEEPSPENGQNICSPSSEPHVDRRLTCSGVRPGSPTRLFTHCYHCPVPCSLQHDTLHVDLGRPEPCYPTCVIVTLIMVYYHTCYRLPYDTGQSRV